MYTILLYSKLPASLSEIIKRKAEDDWLQFDIFKKQLEAEINNLRTFKGKEDISASQSVSTVSTLVVQNKKSQSSSRSEVSSKTCSLFKAAHFWFRRSNYENRDSKLLRLKELGLCYVYAQKGHTSVKCKKKNCGNGCTYVHNIYLCPKLNGDSKSKGDKEKGKPEQNTKIESVKVATLTVGSDNAYDKPTNMKYTPVLPTATILLKGVKKSMVKARGLLELCAEKTFVRKSLLNRVKYKVRGTTKLKLHGYCSSIPEKTYDVVTLFIPCWDNLISLDSIVVDDLPEYKKSVP